MPCRPIPDEIAHRRRHPPTRISSQKLRPTQLYRKTPLVSLNLEAAIAVMKLPKSPLTSRPLTPVMRTSRSLGRPTTLDPRRVLPAPLPPKRMHASGTIAHVVNFVLLPLTAESAGRRPIAPRRTPRVGKAIGIADGPRNGNIFFWEIPNSAHPLSCGLICFAHAFHTSRNSTSDFFCSVGF